MRERTGDMRLFVAALIALAPAVAVCEPLPQSPGAYEPSATDLSAQGKRPRIRVYSRPPAAWTYPRPGEYSWPGPNAVRLCTDWYRTEYRASGTVITPQMSCRWVRG